MLYLVDEVLNSNMLDYWKKLYDKDKEFKEQTLKKLA